MIPTHNSPDRAEAMMLAFANQTPGILEYYQMRAETPDKEPGSAGELPDDGLQRVYEDTVRELEGAHTEKVKMAKGKSDIGISSDSGWTPPGFKR